LGRFEKPGGVAAAATFIASYMVSYVGDGGLVTREASPSNMVRSKKRRRGRLLAIAAPFEP